MGSGRKRLPTAIKELRGTVEPSRENRPLPQTIFGVIPTPPEWFNHRQAEIFRELASVSAGMNVMSVEDSTMMSLLAIRMWELETLTDMIESDGYIVFTENEKTGVTMQRINPAVTQRNEALRHVQSLLNEFGLSPAARSKVTANKSTEDNPFKALDDLTGG